MYYINVYIVIYLLKFLLPNINIVYRENSRFSIWGQFMMASNLIYTVKFFILDYLKDTKRLKQTSNKKLIYIF